MSAERLLVVTTRSQLRHVRFLPHMLNATLAIRRQLDGADGVVRWASIVAGPTEFWTISAWDSRHRMQEFMRSDAHGRWMWRFSDWLSSFWLMRWRPGRREIGRWDGLALSSGGRPSPVEAAAPADPPGEVLASIRDEMPGLYEALDPEGAPPNGRSSDVRRARRHLAGAAGVIVRIRVRPVRLPVVLGRLRRVRRDLRQDDRVVGCAVGIGRRDEAFLLGVWRDRAGAVELLQSDWTADARERFGDGFWASDWQPESEFGHWDGRRLRSNGRVRRRPDA